MEPSFNLPGSSHDFRTVEGLSDWLVGQLAAGRTVGEVEEEFRLYLLALLFRGESEEHVEAILMTFGMEQETANWFMRTTPRRSRAEDGGSAALSMEVMGRPMGLRYASREDGHRDNLNDRIERRLNKAGRLVQGEEPPDARLDFNDQLSFKTLHGGRVSHDVMRRWLFGFLVAIVLMAIAAILWRW